MSVALVVGGSSGIGAACAAELAASGCAVVATGRRFAEALRPPHAGEVGFVHLEPTDEAAVRALVGALPALEVVVYAAGQGVFAPIASADAADLRAMLDVHVVGFQHVAKAALARMTGGHIFAIGSHVAHRAFPTCGAYTAAKSAQLGLARVLAEEARPLGIRVTSLLCGATDTSIWDDRPDFDRTKMLKPADIARFLVGLLAQPALSVTEVTVMPPAGAL
ncbi:MAG TPA: SDR family oxidoreductase [Kofleriaceae bacterium]